MLAVFLGALLGAAARSVGLPEKLSYGVPLVLGLPAFVFAIWYSVAPQGRIHVEAHAVVVRPRLRRSRRRIRRSAPPVLRAWQTRTDGVTWTNGPLLELEDEAGAFAIGAVDPTLATSLPLPDAPTLLVPPDFIVASDDFAALARELGADRAPRP